MQKIEQNAYQKRMTRMTEIFSDIVSHADLQTTQRCPYKNRLSHCTAAFGCRNQRQASSLQHQPIRVCRGDDQLNYRSVWETPSASKCVSDTLAKGTVV